MSATMARLGGQVQLKQSDMPLVLSMAKMAKGGFSCPGIEDTQYLIKKPRGEVRDETKRVVEFPGHTKVKPVMERHPARICQNHIDSRLPCQNSTARNRQTCWRRKGTDAPPPVRHRHQTPDPTPSPPGMPPQTPGPIQGSRGSQNHNLRAANADSRVPLPKTKPVNLDALAEDSLNDEDFDPELLTDERISCG